MNGLRILFMGTPDFALPSLESIIRGPDEIALVITQPDRKSGRGRKITPPPVKDLALQHDLPCYQPRSLKAKTVWETISSTRPDVCVVAAYGKILPPSYLELPTYGCINVHASLLPRWRGASPINWAILAGDRHSGVTITQMDSGLDTGPMLETWQTEIAPAETAGELHDRLAAGAVGPLQSILAAFRCGESPSPTPQDDALATYAPRLEKRDGLVGFHRPADQVAAHINGMSPWPGATCQTSQGPLKLLRALPATHPSQAPPGTVVSADPTHGLLITVADGQTISILQCQRPGRQCLDTDEMLCGLRSDLVGEVWSSES